jgi:predicted phosphodiesterase
MEEHDFDREEAVRGPLAFIADVHGNLKALDAVLDALDDAGVGSIYVAGDLVFGGDDPLAVWKRLTAVHAHCVRGPSDLALAMLEPSHMVPTSERERDAKERFLRTREALGTLIIERLRRLPEALRLRLPDRTDLLVVHGSPRDATTHFSHDMTDQEMEALMADDPADLVLCGGGHIPFVRALDAARVVCVGSVGEAPGARVAHYTLVTPAMPDALVEQRWVHW